MGEDAIHYIPKYHYYRNAYNAVTECTYCQAVGLYEDCHPARPCTNCGYPVRERDLGAKWIPPKYKWFRKVKKGYWKFADEKERE